MKYKNITIIGTSHIAKQSIEDVKNTINNEKPDIIALELDRKRLYSLVHKGEGKIRIRDIFKIGIKGYLFLKFGSWAESC